MADTHALFWYAVGKLKGNADEIFKSVELGESTIFIPTIVLAKCLYLLEKGKIERDFDDLLRRIEMSRNFIPASFNFPVMRIVPEIGLKELHDRVIVATAKMLNAKLLTKDKN